MFMNSIVLFSIKGGTGKTTLSNALGWIMAERGHSVLMIDMDPQGHLTQLVNGKLKKGKTNLYYSLIHEQPLINAVVPTPNSNLFLVPATEDHFYLNNSLMTKPWREWKLRDALNAIHPFPYDLVIIDMGSSVNLMTYAGLFAAEVLLIPVLPDFLSYLSLNTLFNFLHKSCKDYKYSFKMIWILANKFNNHRPLDRENRKALKKFYGKFLLPLVVREDLRFSQATNQLAHITTHGLQSSAIRDLLKLAEFIESIFSIPKLQKDISQEVPDGRYL